MKTKKIASVLLIFCITASLIGCGSSVPATNENMSGENSEIVEGSIDGIEETTGAEERETTVIPELTDAPTPTATPNPMSAPTAESTPEPTASPEPTEQPHSHQYAETVTRQATCAEAGEKKLVCECGDAKEEAIPATGNHNWVEGTNVIHHEALGHVSSTETQVQVGTTVRTEYACSNCGERFDTPSGVVEHCKATGDINHAFASTIAYDYSEPVYETRTETVWVVDQEAWDESVGNGVFTCSVCGATK